MSDAWIRALRFAALPGAQRVTFERQSLIEDGTPTIRYRLCSFDSSGAVIGDNRDYDLLKAAMSPLETLADAEKHNDFTLSLHLATDRLTRES